MSDLDKSKPDTPDHKDDVSVNLERQGLGDLPICLQALSSEEYIKVGRKATMKMDLILLPCLMAMYILNYLDRNNIASAKLANIMEDLDLSETEYQTCVSILFVGYSMGVQFTRVVQDR
ncbi:hypothetical protein N0V95_002208 [Ascochyta clinopodiicola]|nr:hypothetical protein N0V95_002208 [Ascochyta clinopodiicola]